MKINYIKLYGEADFNYSLNSNVTIIYDESGSGKTLLFKMIEFVLGSDGTQINKLEAEKIFPKSQGVEMSIGNRNQTYILKRSFDLKTQTISDNGINLDGDYKALLDTIINHNSIKVLKNQKYDASSFTLREYIKSIFFNESRLTSTDHLYGGNPIEKTKNINFYKYLVTGMFLDVKDISDSNKQLKSKDEIATSLRTIEREISQPTLEDKKEYKKLRKTIENNELKFKENNEMLVLLQKEKQEKVINFERLKSLKQLFESQIEDLTSAKQFTDFIGSYAIKCECGKEVKVIEDEINDNDFIILVSKVKDLTKQISIINTEIKNLKTQILNIEQKNKILLNEIEINNEQLEILDRKIQEYDAYIKIKSIFEKKVEDKTAEENIKLEQVKIDEAFSTEINKICSKIGKRLQAWGIGQYANVQFDMADFDFKFGGTSRYLLSKGYRNICTFASVIEILLKSMSLKINLLETIVVDSLWSHLFRDDNDVEEIINKIVEDLEQLDVQVLIIENKIPSVHSERTTIQKLKKKTD